MEFGPNDPTPALVTWDWHISNADGDFSSRFTRAGTTEGLFDFIQSVKGGFQFKRTGAGVSTVGGSIDPLVKHYDVVITTDATLAQDYVSNHFFTAYQASNITDPFDLGCTVSQTELNYGVSPASRATGTAQASVVIARILGSGGTAASNEIGLHVGWFNLIAGEVCSAWYTDWNLQGSVATQPGELSGINMVVNNYYNGSPSRRASYCAAFVTVPGQGAGLDAAHAAATAYKIDIGVAIQGYGGTIASPTRGMEVGLLIGGNNTNWMNSAAYNSKIGTGIRLTDIESVGIDLDDPATTASSPIGISVTTTTRTWDTFIDLSTGLAPTTNAIKLGQDRRILFATIGLRDRGTETLQFDGFTSTTNFVIRVVPNFTTIASTASRCTLRLYSSTAITDAEYLELRSVGTSGFIIGGTKENAGTYRDLNLTGGGVNCFTVTSASLLTSLVGHKFENYSDHKVITIPADPAAGYGRMYCKAVDANNDGLYVKLKIAGTITEIQVA